MTHNPTARLSAKLHRRVCLVLTEDAMLAEELLSRKKARGRGRGAALGEGAAGPTRQARNRVGRAAQNGPHAANGREIDDCLAVDQRFSHQPAGLPRPCVIQHLNASESRSRRLVCPVPRGDGALCGTAPALRGGETHPPAGQSTARRPPRQESVGDAREPAGYRPPHPRVIRTGPQAACAHWSQWSAAVEGWALARAAHCARPQRGLRTG